MNRTMTLVILTVLCIMSLGAGEILGLDTVMLISTLGFFFFGAAVLYSAFSNDNPFDEEEDHDSDT
jgi:hypothetical protein